MNVYNNSDNNHLVSTVIFFRLGVFNDCEVLRSFSAFCFQRDTAFG